MKGTNPQTTVVKDNEKGKANVGVVVITTEAKILQIPHEQRGSQFEEQLKKIDAAIFRDTLDTTNHHKAVQSTSMTEVIQTNVQATQTQMKVEDDARHDRPQEMSKSNLMSTPGSQPHNGPANKAQVNFITLLPFIMGLTSPARPTKPKPKKSNQINLRKGRVGPAMQRKENVLCRGIVRVKGDDLGTGTMMEVEQNEKSGKRRTRPPLKDISGLVENVKRKKVDGDVMALRKLMAQELGSVVATGQPCQEQ